MLPVAFLFISIVLPFDPLAIPMIVGDSFPRVKADSLPRAPEQSGDNSRYRHWPDAALLDQPRSRKQAIDPF
jgi:hypothetical protein